MSVGVSGSGSGGGACSSFGSRTVTGLGGEDGSSQAMTCNDVTAKSGHTPTLSDDTKAMEPPDVTSDDRKGRF